MVKCNKDQVERLKKALKRHTATDLREDGKTQPQIAELTGVSLSTVNRAHMAYDNGGVNALKPKPSAGRIRENITLKEERAFLAQFAKAPDRPIRFTYHCGPLHIHLFPTALGFRRFRR